MTIYELLTLIWITFMGISALIEVVEYIKKTAKSKRRSNVKK